MLFTMNTFKALSSKTRVFILWKLKSRRMTLTEISDVLGMHASTVSDHLVVLERAGLVAKANEGYKWKYYFLTKDGEGVFFAKEVSILLPGIAMIAMGVWDLFRPVAQSGAGIAEEAMKSAATPPALSSTIADANVTNGTASGIGTLLGGYPVEGVLLVLAGIIFLSYIIYLKRKKQ